MGIREYFGIERYQFGELSETQRQRASHLIELSKKGLPKNEQGVLGYGAVSIEDLQDFVSTGNLLNRYLFLTSPEQPPKLKLALPRKDIPRDLLESHKGYDPVKFASEGARIYAITDQILLELQLPEVLYAAEVYDWVYFRSEIPDSLLRVRTKDQIEKAWSKSHSARRGFQGAVISFSDNLKTLEPAVEKFGQNMYLLGLSRPIPQSAITGMKVEGREVAEFLSGLRTNLKSSGQRFTNI